MFTGLIQSVGQVKQKQPIDGDLSFVIDTHFPHMSDVQLGDSIAINGVCLTVTKMVNSCIAVDVSVETLNKTNIAWWHIDTQVNLEKSLTLQDKLGGHMVSGHVDGIAQCMHIETSARSSQYQFRLPEELDKYVVKKGSLAINGVSLTVNEIHQGVVAVNLIPHTLSHTNLGLLAVGDWVNIEVDMLARYVEKMLNAQTY